VGVLRELHRHLLKSYNEALEDELENIQQAFAWKNSEQLAEYTHKLKSSSRSLGAMEMAHCCQEIETAARADNWDELEKLLPNLQRAAAQVGEFIDLFLDDDSQGETPAAPPTPEFVLELPDDDEDITQFSIKLLLVDDDYIMHRVTTVMLNDLGISGVLNAMSGPAALDLLADNGGAIDVIICDLNMPGMDGVELIRHLAAKNYSGSIILTSGEDVRILKTVEKLAIEHDLHVLGVLEKPATPAKISELLDQLDQIREEIAEGNRRTRHTLAGASLMIGGTLLNLGSSPLTPWLSNVELGSGISGLGLLLMLHALLRR